MIGIVFHAALLWLLITYYTRQTNSDQSWREAKIVLICMICVTVVTRYLLFQFLGFLVLAVEAAALYMIIDKVLETSQRVTVRICVWYFGVILLVGGFFELLSYFLAG